MISQHRKLIVLYEYWFSLVRFIYKRDKQNHFPTQNLLSDAECKICKYKSLIIRAHSSNYGGADTMPRDGGGTENIQKPANEAAVKNKIYKHLQRRFSSSLYIHIR